MSSRQTTPPTEPGAVANPSSSPRIALLPWGDLIEDFLDGIGLSLDDFSAKMTGGWLFGYVEALRRKGVQSTIFCFSGRVADKVRTVHQSTGAEIVLLPAPAIYRRARRKMKDPYGWTAEAMFGASHGFSRQRNRLVRHLAPYLATPVTTLAREIRQEGCSAILCQEYESPRFDASVAVGKLLRIPVFGVYQGGNYQRSGIERIVRPMTLRGSAGLIIGSSMERARVQGLYGTPAERIFRVFNPLDLSEWRPHLREDARRALGISDAARLAIWHGRIDIRTKGLDLLLEAWDTICSRRPEQDLSLFLIGTGSDAKELTLRINRMAVRRIRWINEYVLDRSAMRRYLSAADVYVFPSRREGFPVAPLEAMACGLPVVAASAPGVIDIFEAGEAHGGIVVGVEDVPALAQSLGRLLDNPAEARALGARARARVEQVFSLDSVGAELFSLLRSSRGRHHSPNS